VAVAGVADQGGQPADRPGVGVHVAVDRGPEGLAAGEAVLAARGVDRADRVFGGVGQRLDPVQLLVEVVVVVPQGVDVLHHGQVPGRGRLVAVDQEPGPGGVGDRFAEVAVVAPLAIHEVDIVARVAPVAQPAALLDVEACGVVEAGIGLALPADVVKELGGDVAARAQVALVGAEHAPAVIVDLVQLLVRGFEQRDVAFVPGGVVAESSRGDGVGVQLWRGRHGGRRDQGRRRPQRQGQPRTPSRRRHSHPPSDLFCLSI
jgi:hypothetical protein